MYDYGTRWYAITEGAMHHPQLGRFIQPDTIVPNPGDAQAFDRYAYVSNNPLRYTDPTGHTGIEQRCPYCNIQWFDYSVAPEWLDGAVDGLAVAGCFFTGCHADTEKNTVTGPTEQEAAYNSMNQVLSMGMTPIGMVGVPGAQASNGILPTLTRRIVKQADEWVAKYAAKGSTEIVEVAAKNGDPVLPGLFKYGSEMSNLPGYQRHHLWPRALGGPEDGWAIYVQTNPTNWHTSRGGLQTWVDSQLVQRTGLNLSSMRQWAQNNPQDVVSMLREIYTDLGIDFPY